MRGHASGAWTLGAGRAMFARVRGALRTGAWLSVAIASLALAQPARDPLAARDPAELARAVDRAGDAAVLARLAARSPPAAAARAARYLEGPELALERLGELAGGRDPDLAPAAAAASIAIVEALDDDQLRRREVDPASLREARARFARLASDASARPDLRAAGEYVAERLAELGAR